MVHIKTVLALCLSIPLFATPEFVIVVASYNNEKYVERNLSSLIHQRSSKPYQIIYVDDCSTDRTGILAEKFAKDHNLSEDVLKIVHNKERLGTSIENIYNTVHTLVDDEKVVVSVDGDDTLSFSGVLERLEEEYKDPNVWMTFGRFVVIPNGECWSICWSYPDEVTKARSFRQCPNVPSHLKTFKAGLFKKIKKEDLLGPDGTFLKKAGDMGFMFPLLELCTPYNDTGHKHWSFIEDTILYVYNAANELNDHRIGRQEQIDLDLYVRSKKPYQPLEKLN